MAKKAATKRRAYVNNDPETKGNDVWQIITDRIIAQLEKGRIPWEKPWDETVAGEYRKDFNGVSGKFYAGMNVIALFGHEFASGDWYTYKQLTERGGKIKEEHKKNGHLVVFWKIFSKWVADDDSQDDGDDYEGVDGDVSGRQRKFPMLRYYRVWNYDQIEGMPPCKRNPYEEAKARAKKLKEESNFTPIDLAEQIVASYTDRPEIIERGDRACYSPDKDMVFMPIKEAFKNSESYYSTLFHELAHSTGHEARLNRNMKGYFGSSNYAREELCAEMTASFLSANAGFIEPLFDNKVAYIQSWLQKLKDDKKCVVMAAQAAQRAADWMLGRAAENEQTQDHAAD